MADPRGGATPLKLDQLCFLNPFFFIRMLKHKAQIARESIKITDCRGLKRALDPAESEFAGSALVMCVLVHNLLRPPPPPKKKNENPGSAPESMQFSGKIAR